MSKVNVAGCELDKTFERGEFRCAALHFTERLGANVIGASVFEMQAGDKMAPYHFHFGVEEWHEQESATSEPIDGVRGPVPAQSSPLVNVMSIAADPPPASESRHGSRARRVRLVETLAVQTWGATLYGARPR